MTTTTSSLVPPEEPGLPPKFLQPTGKGKVMNLVESCGIDVSKWSVNSDGQPIRTASNKNPHYCYGWTFAEGRTTVCCFWWEEMREDEHGIYTRLRILEHQKLVPNGIRKIHTDDLADALLNAYANETPIDVLVVSGERRRSPTDSQQSRVKFRQKDPTRWYVCEINSAEGWILVRRGGRLIHGVWHSAASLSSPLGGDELAILTDWKEIDALDLAETEKAALRKARIGQGAFRDALVQRWDGRCALTGLAIKEALRASHCVPWRKASNSERLSPKNGLLLSATLDALFDAGLISFDDEGNLIQSKRLGSELADITQARTLRKRLDVEEIEFLRRHREDEFDKLTRYSPSGFAS